jgi:carboxypeptidase C (cathepsin A)
MRPRLLLTACIALAAPLSAQRGAAAPGAAVAGRGGRASDTGEGVVAVDRISTTQHTVTIGGKSIAYTANAGTLVLRSADGKPRASIFFVAYTRDGQDTAKRPITFFYNGGPGAATIWLHMGLMGPKRVQLGPEGFQTAPPYHLVDNESSPLDVTDLVSIDAVMTGYSRPAEGVATTEFTGAQEDIQTMGEFIREYLTRYNRWASPKYLFGESYGTFRSAGLAAELQDNQGIELNGVMLLGTVLDFGNISQGNGNDIGYANYLPTYTATAWYHKKLPPDLENGDVKKAVDEARAYAWGDYLTALAKGNRLTAAERNTVAASLSRLTGLSSQYILNSNLRVGDDPFRVELLRDQREIVGRLDSRLLGINRDAASTREDYDPSEVSPTGPYLSMFLDYMHNDLKWDSDLQYYTGGHTGRWDYSNFTNRYASETDALRATMARNPFLHVLVASGYYDMATPFGNAEYTFAHLGFDSTYTNRVKFTYYPSGHMVYTNPDALRMIKHDIADFIGSTAAGGETMKPPR